MLGYDQTLDFKYFCLVLRVILPEEVDRDNSQLTLVPPLLRLFGLLYAVTSM